MAAFLRLVLGCIAAPSLALVGLEGSRHVGFMGMEASPIVELAAPSPFPERELDLADLGLSSNLTLNR